ncbi:MAG: hypothetical protein HY735_32875 [Verrucomicrobia bacterium]|nr:hypothetical protein [Verrucomicrobiota bacterium]
MKSTPARATSTYSLKNGEIVLSRDGWFSTVGYVRKLAQHLQSVERGLSRGTATDDSAWGEHSRLTQYLFAGHQVFLRRRTLAVNAVGSP